MHTKNPEIDGAAHPVTSPRPEGALRYTSAAFALFFMLAFAFAAWLPRLPELKSAFLLSDGDIGFVLLALPVGLLTVMPVVGYASSRLSLRSLNLICMTWMYVSIPLLGLVTGPTGLAVVICAIGMGAGAMGVAINAAGFAAEAQVGRPILSRCHAMYSLGLASGGLIAGAIAAQGVSIFAHLVITNAVLLVLLLFLVRGIADDTKPSGTATGPNLAFPTGKLVVPGLIAMGCLMAEGVTVDWSSIFLADVLNAPAIYIGAGVAAFSGAMAAMRFAGDALVSRFPEHVIIGTGLAPIVPIAFRIAGRLSPNAPGVGVAAVSTLGYAGFLIGPALVGIIAEMTSLRASFATTSGLMICVAILSRKLGKLAANPQKTSHINTVQES